MGLGGTYSAWILAALGSVVVGILIVGVIRHNLRVWRVRRAYQTLPVWVRDRVLDLIQEAASGRPSMALLRPDEELQRDARDALLQSHVGGSPYAEAGDAQSIDDSAIFLLQVRLNEPELGEAWRGRLLTAYLVRDSELVVRSYGAPHINRFVADAAPASPRPCIPLTLLRFPVEIEDEEPPFPSPPARICALMPAIPELLGEFTDDPAGLLSQIICPGFHGSDLDAPEIAYVGGEPLLIQNPHDPTCDVCGDPMRFLFQVGEVVLGLQLADAGVCYVYGCDRHPSHCKGFIDSH